ncbi:c-Myc-binding protein-like [Corticium candelabrum]|uniref:c-Myc-binding protein-like n=1 Tax=Corticium candelabrum TaxID=121492 RepID=UPI002E275AA3|nr:c-Myc-binding protein-like [Corticium candelabrum]
MTSSHRTVDSKREEFRKYLEKAGLLDVLTKVLVGLYEEPEKPANPLEFVQRHLHDGDPETHDIEKLRQEVVELRAKNASLEEDNAALKARIEQLDVQEASGEQT